MHEHLSQNNKSTSPGLYSADRRYEGLKRFTVLVSYLSKAIRLGIYEVQTVLKCFSKKAKARVNMSFFGVNVTNPFTSPVGQRIEQATDANLTSENWALNMEICDIINESEDGPRDAIKAIKRRLNQAAGKNYTIVMYTLIVLETCVKNCGKRFHALACSREFVQELVKLIGPKNEPPTEVQEKVLNLIQTWADTFRNQPHTQGVVQVYQELKAKGIDFPMTDLDAMAPIITPERSVPELESSAACAVAGAIPPSGVGAAAAAAAADDPGHLHHQKQWSCNRAAVAGGDAAFFQLVKLSEQQMAKLRSELEVVHGNMRVLSEMLVAHSGGLPEKASERAVAEDLEILADLHSTCKAMQERVVYLIPKLAHPELTAELLQINDEMNNLFMRYARFTKGKHQVPASTLVAQAIGATTDLATSADGSPSSSAAATKKKLEVAESLIDLSDDEAGAKGATARVMNLMEKRIAGVDIGEGDGKSIRKDGEKDEFDAFAQSRTASFDAAKNRQELRGSDEEAEAGAIGTSTKKNLTQSDKTLTSSEFERFLAERTAAAALEVSGQAAAVAAPASAPSGSGSSSSNAMGSTLQRQIDKDAEDKSLFAL